MNETSPADPAPPGPRAGSRLDDYVDIYLSPTEVFERRRDGRWGQPLLVVIVALVALYYLFLPAAEILADATAERGLARMMEESPEAAEAVAQMRAMRGTFILLGGLTVALGIAATVPLLAALLKGLAALFGAGLSFGQALVVAAFARFVLLPRSLASNLAVLWADRTGPVDPVSDTSFGPLRFLDSAAVSDAAAALLDRLDVFALWEAALWAVGVYIMARTTKGAAIAVAALTLLAAAVPPLLAALF